MSAGPIRSASETIAALRAARVIAVIRAESADEAVEIVSALASGGLRAIEVTFTTPGIEGALDEARRRAGAGVLLGAGTVTRPDQVALAVDAGADFLVSPHLNLALLHEMLATGLLSVPGVLTPSEASFALDAGAAVLKLFPASTVGVGHLRALHGPFPGLQVIPTGGVTPATAREWLDAGALAVGLGSELLPRELRRAGDWDEIARRAARLVADLATDGGRP